MILLAYAFSASVGDWNLAPPMIIRYLILGTLVRASPCHESTEEAIRLAKDASAKD
jgi:hypothetical protein